MNYILVTGAAGFIGSAVARKLIEMNKSVITIDNLSTGYIHNIPKECIFIEGDVGDEKIINKLKKYEINSIIHIAGQSSGEVSFSDPVYDLNTNTKSTLLLLQYARQKAIKNFIYISTMSVYGDKTEIVNENTNATPISFYGVGKLASEGYLKIYNKYGINCSALRLFNVYGPGQNMKNLKQGMLSIFLSQALKDKKIHIKGSGERFRDFIYIDDVVNSIITCLDNLDHNFQRINIGTGKKTTVVELVEKIKKLLQFDIEIKFEGSTEGDVHGIIADNSLLRNKIGKSYKFTTLDEGLSKMINWAQDNESST